MINMRSSFLRRPLFWIALVVLALIAGGAYFFFSQSSTRAAATVTVTRGDLKATVNANARVRAVKTVDLAFPLSGLVKAVNVQVGDVVQADQVLAELETREVQRRVDQAHAALDARQQDLDLAQAPPSGPELEIARQTLKRAALALAAAQDRYKKSATSENEIAQELAQSDYDIARANFERQTRGASQADLDRLQRAVENARADLNAAKESAGQTQLQAPFTGTVLDVKIEVGELLGGFNPVITLADLNRLELVADIDEIDVAEVNAGQSVDLRFDAFPGKSASGTVTRLAPAASTDRGATVYRATIALDPTDLKLRPGMGATATIATIEKRNVLRLPTRAIRTAGTQKIVAVQDGSGTRNVVVQVGLSDGNNTEIISGVSEGTTIVVE